MLVGSGAGTMPRDSPRASPNPICVVDRLSFPGNARNGIASMLIAQNIFLRFVPIMHMVAPPLLDVHWQTMPVNNCVQHGFTASFSVGVARGAVARRDGHRDGKQTKVIPKSPTGRGQ